MIRKLLKYIAGFSPFPLTKNEYYDRLTEQVIKKVCSKNSVCVDVGANQGKILEMFIKHCPAVLHHAFEPVPKLYFQLVRKYGSAAKIYQVALSDKNENVLFHHVTDDEAYSSLQQRTFNQPKDVRVINVQTNCLDNLIPETVNIKLIKLDIEGGEYDALKGANKTINRCNPYILFEFGKGGSEAFGVTPPMIYNFFDSQNYQLNLLKAFLKSHPSLTFTAFNQAFENGDEYFFIAYPKALA